MTAIKMTKTEQRILQEAASNARGGVSRTAEFRRGVEVGKLGLDGIRSLYSKGFLGSFQKSNESEAHRGRIRRYYTLSAVITDAGRKALEG